MTGAQFKAARKRLGYSQQQLASMWNVTRQSITNWERNDPPGYAQDAIRYRELSMATGQAMAILNEYTQNQEEQS